MSSIDKPVEQTRRQYLEEPESHATGLMKKLATANLPIIGPAFEYFQSEEQKERQKGLSNAILDILSAHEKSIDDINERMQSDEFIHMIAIAVERIFWGASEKKARRFAAVIAYELEFGKDLQGMEDAASFIRAIDELSESDIKVLVHLYEHQKDFVVPDHSIEYNSFFQNNRMQSVLHSVSRLRIPMDDFYARCGRLSGYGLVLPLERRTDSIGPSEFAFRITLWGRTLVEMLIAGNQTGS